MRFSLREWRLIIALFVLAAGWGVDRRMLAIRNSAQQTEIDRLKEFNSKMEEALTHATRELADIEFFKEWGGGRLKTVPSPKTK
jgi:hypothetical protein